MRIHRGEVNRFGNGHKPLVQHVSSNTLDQVLSWSQRFKMRLKRFHYKEINRVPGEMS